MRIGCIFVVISVSIVRLEEKQITSGENLIVIATWNSIHHLIMNNCDSISSNQNQTAMPKRFRCRSKRLRRLAKPKFITPKFSTCEEEVDNKFKVQIIKEEQIPVRIKMLAFPKVRKLVATREEFDSIVDKEWNSRFKTLIDKSKVTLYSRLANVTLPDPSKKKEKWTVQDWQKHSFWLKKNAQPKPIFVAQPEQPKSIYMKRYRVPTSDDDDLDVTMHRLAMPRHPRKKYKPFCGYKSTVDTSALTYNITERTLKLSKKPEKKEEVAPLVERDPFSVNPIALKAKPTKRIIELAKPKEVKKPSTGPSLTEYGVLARSLKATSSQRTLELAKPRDHDDDDDEVRPFVNPKALKAKPSKRILELAMHTKRVTADI